MQSLAIYCWLFIGAISPFGEAMAWEDGKDYDRYVECVGLPLNGADSVVVRTKAADGSFGEPRLVGLKDAQVSWDHPLPKIGSVNIASLEASCDKNRIRLAYRFPMGVDWLVSDFVWNGKTIRFVRKKVTRRYRPL